MKKIPRWIFLKYDQDPNYFLCKCCGGTRPVHLPAAIDDVVKQSEAFAESHKYCNKEKKCMRI